MKKCKFDPVFAIFWQNQALFVNYFTIVIWSERKKVHALLKLCTVDGLRQEG